MKDTEDDATTHGLVDGSQWPSRDKVKDKRHVCMTCFFRLEVAISTAQHTLHRPKERPYNEYHRNRRHERRQEHGAH